MKRVLLLLGLTLVGCAFEPTYEGKTASAWREDLKHKDPMGRCHAAAVIAVLGAPKDAIPDLIELLKDNAYYVRAEAAVALGRMGPDAKVAVPALTELVKKDSHGKVRAQAVDALLRIDAQAGQQAEELFERSQRQKKAAK